MNWLWLNIPLMAVFFLTMAGIPLWLVFRHPDTGPVTAQSGSMREPAPAPAAREGAPTRELAGAAR